MRNSIIVFLLLAAVSIAVAQTYVFGAVSGVWDSTGSPYYITDSVCVPSGDSLRIGPGVEVIFQGHYKFCVDSMAVLKAIGTAEDSIVFTAEDTVLTDSTGGHHGIRFWHSADGCTLAYCRIEYGNAIDTCLYCYYSAGGGIFCKSSSPTISNNTMFANYGAKGGGGICCLYSDAIITDNTIYGNSTGYPSGGGGIICASSNATIARNIIYANSAYSGAGIYSSNGSPIINNNTISGNLADGSGGGICCCSNSSATVTNNIIYGNSAIYDGGGIDCSNSNPIVIGNIISGNLAPYDGGGISSSNSSLTAINNIISRNLAGGNGGGLFHRVGYGEIVLINNTITENTANGTGGGICYEDTSKLFPLINNIIWNNTATTGNEISVRRSYAYPCIILMAYNNVDLSECHMDSGSVILFCPGNINAYPMFVDTASGDFHLQDGSPCIDAGAESVYIAIWDTVIYAPTFDYDSVARPLGLGWDIGAYESPYSAVCEVEINRGWNLFSIPSTTSEPTSAFGTSVYGYDATIPDYYTPDSLLNGDGYWALGLSSDSIEVPGNLPSFTDTLYRGWNLIGAIRYPIPISRIATEPAGLGMSPPYGWDGADYFLTDSLYPGKGYWFLSSGDGRITVGP